MGLLTDRISNKLDRSNLTNEHALYSEPVPLTTRTLALPRFLDLLAWAENLAKYALVSSFLNITGMVALTVSLVSEPCP